jgi:hypothetical protein
MATDPLDRARRVATNVLRRMAMLRALSYRRVFVPDAMTRDHEIVLADLRDFCRANRSAFSLDPYNMARLAGRREAWLRITQHLHLDEERVMKIVELEDGLDG